MLSSKRIVRRVVRSGPFSISSTLFALAAGLTLLVPTETSAQSGSPDEVAATVGRLTITRAQLEKHADDDLKRARNAADRRKALENALDKLIAVRLHRLAAERVDVLKNNLPYRIRRRRMLTNPALLVFQDSVLIPQIRIDSTDIDTFYANHPERFIVNQERRRIRYVLSFKDGAGERRDSSSVVWGILPDLTPAQRSDSIYAMLRSGWNFAAVADEFGEDRHLRGKGGMAGWVARTEEKLPRDLREHVFSLPIGQIARPVELGAAYAVVQVVETMPAGVSDLTPDLRARVQRDLEEKQGQLLAAALLDSILALRELRPVDALLHVPVDSIPHGVVMAVSNDDTIFTDDYLALERIRRHGRSDFTPTERIEILHSAARDLALWSLMVDLGFHRAQPVQLVAERLDLEEGMLQIEREIYGGGTEAVRPSLDEIRRYYDEHPEEFRGASPYRITMARFSNLDDAKTARAMIDGGVPWEDAVASNDGVTDPSQWVGKKEVSQRLLDRLRELQVGETTPALAGSVGAYLARLDQLGNLSPFQDHRASIDVQMTERRREERLNNWVRKARQRFPVKRSETIWNDLLSSHQAAP